MSASSGESSAQCTGSVPSTRVSATYLPQESTLLILPILVRRGTWFFQDGSNLRPCEENLAAQVEEVRKWPKLAYSYTDTTKGYLKMKAWTDPGEPRPKNPEQVVVSATATAKEKPAAAADKNAADTESKPAKLKSHRLFGTYMNNTVTYEDANTAWLVSDGVLSWVATSVYERFGRGGHMSGVKLIRGYSDQNKAKEKRSNDKKLAANNEGEVASKKTPSSADAASRSKTSNVAEAALTGKAIMQRRLSTIIESEDRRTATSEDDVQKLNEEEMRHDYLTQSGESQNRNIEHLVLVTHGIGQRLSLRYVKKMQEV